MTESEIKLVNATCRDSGAVGKNAVVPQMVSVCLQADPFRSTVLDYGAGRNQIHVASLREQFKDRVILGYEIGRNYQRDHHISRATAHKITWDVVYASNVINVQPSPDALDETLQELKFLGREGVVIFNYPKSPRKMNMSFRELHELCKHLWDNIKVHDKILVCR